MGMVHCYRCSLPGHYAVFEKPLFTLLINRNTYIFNQRQAGHCGWHRDIK